jgi:CheY-like chemotaxis protein
METKTVCVVEDEPALSEAVKFKLIKAGFNVLTASTGEEALEVFKTHKPDLVWLDVLLPGMNGLEVLRKIKSSSELKDFKVVIVSVSAGPEKIKEAFFLGAVDYLVKSEYTIDQLITKVTEIINN